MADRGPNPDLWMATAGPRQPLKGVFYTQKFLSQNERLGIQCHCSPTSLLAAISSHCLATLPAKMSAFKSHMRQNA